jgi:transcriptional regulator with XRE-family HTH domain
MDFDDGDARKFISQAIGCELRRTREQYGWSRAQFVALLPSGIGERTLLSYERGTRELSVMRLLELCTSLNAEPTTVLRYALQRAGALLDNLALHVDLRALLNDRNPNFYSMHQWARNKLSRNPDGTTELSAIAVVELADFIGCTRDELASYLARFVPHAKCK